MNIHFINKHLIFSLTLLTGIISTLAACSSSTDSVSDTDTVTAISLGSKIFFDTNLSSNANQSCATCHDPVAGFADPSSLETSPVSAGSVSSAFGNRNAPTASYASFSPDFRTTTTAQTSEDGSSYEGGQFYDGRSLNLVEQAKGPFLNPVEMNNSDEADVVNKVKNSDYSDDFKAVFGDTAFDNTAEAYHNIAVAIAAFESASVMNSFTSKFDAYQNDPANNPLTDSELRGFNLFKGSRAKCANCHVVDNPNGGPALFTNFKYFNVGTPVNPDNPDSTQDLGLGAITGEASDDGKFKVPTLRNVALTAPYMHNGAYSTLEEVVRHYDIQVTNEYIDIEVNRNIASELNPGTYTSLGLLTQEYDDLIAFMETLTDYYF